MQNPSSSDYEPSWMMEENDAKHREETAPLLFGDGSIDLQDPPPVAATAAAPEDDDNNNENSGPSMKRGKRRKGGGSSGKDTQGSKGYGSVNASKPTSTKSRTSLALPAGGSHPDDEEDEDDGDGEDSEADEKQQQSSKKPSSLSSLFSVSKLVQQKKTKKATNETEGDEDVESSAPPGTHKKQRNVVAPLTAAALRAKPHVPGINPCLWLFHTLQGVCVVAALMLCVTQVIPLVFAAREGKSSILSTVGWASVALKAYITSFCLVFVAVETDLPVPFLRDSNLFQRYLSRGFLYSFLGLICLEEAYSERVRDIVKKSSTLDNVGWAAIFMQLSSWLMLAVGILYMLMGICCLKGLRDRLRENEQREWREYREALKRWKDVYT